MNKMVVPIRGMHCKSCELLIEEQIKKIPEVEKVDVSHVAGRAKIWFQAKAPSHAALSRAIADAGYEIGDKDKLPWLSRNIDDYKQLFNAAAILLFLFILAKWSGIDNLSVNLSQKSVAMAGVVGLVAGFSSCMALIGGLVLGLSARHSELHPEATGVQKFRPHLYFNLGRVVGFAFFGGLVGLVGAALQPSIKTLSGLTIVVGLVMVFLGLKLIEIFPVLRDKSITLPKFISKFLGIKTESKEYSHKGAFVSGALSFFLPCGFTQAMQLYAISTGSFIQGALIMSLFALGTAPGLLGVGGLSAAFKGRAAKLFFATAGLAVILLGFYNISNASRIVFPRSGSGGSSAVQAYDQPAQTISTVYKSGADISPKNFTVKAGQSVRFLVNVQDDGFGCMSTIMIPGLYNTPLYLKGGTTLTMDFTPTKKGSYPITCAMGIKRGVLTAQ